MNATMASQRTRITEGLYYESELCTMSNMTEAYLSTSLAHVRLLSRVDALVDCQSGTLNELLAAIGEVAYVRTDATVNTFCRSQCTAF